MAKRKPEEIVDLVESHYDATEPLRQRMQDDHALYRLEPYDAGEGPYGFPMMGQMPISERRTISRKGSS